MKIAVYCQHVLGIGHFFRILEICRALAPHPVVLISGGPETPATLPPNVKRIQLPELAMDTAFQNLHAGGVLSVAQAREERQMLMEQVLKTEKPDLFLIELYPLGRKAFRAELNPLLEGIHSGRLPSCRVVCSVRDILVEKEDQARHEARAVKTLNRLFDALLVHADPTVVRLEATFDRMGDICIPVVYTGFIAPSVRPARDRQAWKRARGIAPGHSLVVVSAGSGAVGFPLLEAAIRAVRQLPVELPIRAQVFTGPFMAAKDADRLRRQSDPRTVVAPFTPDLPAWLQAADLSISMAGYNTCMALLATGVRGLVYPFAQNREQGMRARLLAERNLLAIIEEQDLAPSRLAGRLLESLASRPSAGGSAVEIDGAARTAQWITAISAHIGGRS